MGPPKGGEGGKEEDKLISLNVEEKERFKGGEAAEVGNVEELEVEEEEEEEDVERAVAAGAAAAAAAAATSSYISSIFFAAA